MNNHISDKKEEQLLFPVIWTGLILALLPKVEITVRRKVNSKKSKTSFFFSGKNLKNLIMSIEETMESALHKWDNFNSESINASWLLSSNAGIKEYHFVSLTNQRMECNVLDGSTTCRPIFCRWVWNVVAVTYQGHRKGSESCVCFARDCTDGESASTSCWWKCWCL